MNTSTIQHIQNQLRTVDSFANQSTPLAVDGIWGDITIDTLKQFQRAYGLPDTGEPDFETLEALEDSYIIAKNSIIRSVAVNAFPESGVQFKKGDFSPIIMILQVMINFIAARYNNIMSVNSNGRFEADTEKAVKSLQSYSDLLVNGIVDKLTWNAITLLYNSFSKRS